MFHNISTKLIINPFQAQIHLLGNIAIWYSSTLSVLFYVALMVFYFLRRRRQIIDLSNQEWMKFESIGYILLMGYAINFAPYFFVERTLFLHNYLPALIYKICLLCAVVEHVYNILRKTKQNIMIFTFKLIVVLWLVYVFYVFKTFLAVSYGRTKLTSESILSLRWRDTWDFIFS